jgi:hypothetical protein
MFSVPLSLLNAVLCFSRCIVANLTFASQYNAISDKEKNHQGSKKITTFLAEIQLGAKTIKSLFDVTLESFDSAEIRELLG